MANNRLITLSVIGINGNPISATTFGIPSDTLLAEAITFPAGHPFELAVNKITELHTNTIYYVTSTTASIIAEDGTLNNLLAPSGAAISVLGKDGIAYPSAVNTLFPTNGVRVNVVSGLSGGLSAANSQITVFAIGTIYYTAATTANIIAASIPA